MDKTLADFDAKKDAERWQGELKMAKREDDKWLKRGKRIVKRYRDERGDAAKATKKYNILWANIQTLFPALYGKTPRAQVERRFKDQDPIGRCASQIIERALQFEIDHYGTFDAANKNAVLDRLLPGRGTAWVRFEIDENRAIDGQDSQYGKTCEDSVFWEDFACSPARTWEDVTWVARRVYMTKDEGVKRFGDDFKEVPLTHEPVGLDDKNKTGDDEAMKKAQVWELWDKTTKAVYWFTESHDKLLDAKSDPYGLDGFWPCPKPLFATQTTDTLVPIPDYALYQDQAEELDQLTARIGMLVAAIKVVGVYDASQKGVERMLSEGVNNTLIPVDTWAAFSEKGGLKGVVDFLPLDMVLTALTNCYTAREQAKQVIYEITGLSDIIRGASVASETATAQQIKSQYASLRIKHLQISVATFASDLLRIKAQLMADLYSAEQLIEQSGVMATPDALFADQAVQLLKSEPSRNFRIEVASDSLVEMDELTEKQTRMEFLTATGQFMQQALPVVQQAPELGPLVAEMLLFGVRTFKGGRPMEAAFDDAMAKMSAPKEPQQLPPPPPDPAQIRADTDMQIEQGRMQLEQAKLQGGQQLEQFKADQTMQIEAAKMQHQKDLEQIKQQAETERAQYKADLDAQTRLEIASMNAHAATKPAVEMKIDGKQELGDIGQEVMSMAENATNGMSQAMMMLADAVAQMNKPKRRVLQRDSGGRAVGMIETTEDGNGQA